jgi:hypothetical protein
MASGLAAHERQLALLAIGPARLAAEQIAASGIGAAELVAHHVHNVRQQQTPGGCVIAGCP